MPSRQPAHPLNRWAPVSEYQRGPCARFAVVLADPDSHHLEAIYDAIASYSEHVWDTAYPGVPKSAEHPIIETESWKKALAESLRIRGHRSPDSTARNVFEIGMVLHQWPLRLGQPSILQYVAIAANQYEVQIRLGHLERICVVLRSHFHGMTADEHEATYNWNEHQTISLLSVAIDQSLSPKQLEIHIAKLQGKPTAGRPRRG
jgi:hypothetical protein